MAKTLAELEAEFGAPKDDSKQTASTGPTAGPSSLEELEKSFASSTAAPKQSSGASEIPGGPGKAIVGEAKPEMFEPGLMGGVKRGLAQIGSGMADYPLALRQITGNATPEDVEEKRRLDAQLNTGTMGPINNFAGKVAPAMVAPATFGGPLSAVLGYNALTGATQGALEPVGPGESRALNTVVGALGGMTGPAIVKGLTSLAKPAMGEATDLVKKALAMGIPLGPGDVTSSGVLKAIKSFLSDLPITGPMAKKHADDINKAITSQVGKVAGIADPTLDAATIAARRKSLGGEFNKYWENPIEYDANLFGGLQQLESRLDELSPGVATKFRKDIDKLYNGVVEMPDGKLVIPGQLMDSVQKSLGPIIGAKGEASDVARQFQQELLGAFGRSMPPGSREALAKTKGEWKALTKVIEPLMNSAEAGVAGRESGQIPLGLLSNQVKVAYPNVATSPFKDIAPIAGRYGVDRTPRTGGSMRALVQNAALGTGAYMLGTGSPLATVAGLGALAGTVGAGTQKALSSPALTRRAMAEPVKQALLGAPELRPALRGFMGTAATRAPVAGALSLVSDLTRAEPSALEEE